MSNLWHDCISNELDEVERIMKEVLSSENPELTEMCNYVIEAGGKRIRPAVCILAYYASGGKDPKRAIEIGAAYEVVHNATLIHDDINDQGELRRGRKALYKEYSISKSIIAGDFMFAMGFRLIGATAPDIVDFVVNASAAMSSGEFIQKKFENKSTVTEEDYFEIIEGKTASLISSSAKSGSFLAGADHDIIDAFGEYAMALGKAFQIIDDTLDIIGDTDTTGKMVGVDLIEGKPTLPIIYAMQDPEHGQKIKDVFEKEEVSMKSVDKIIQLIKETDSIKRCRYKAMEIFTEARGYLEVIEDSDYKKALLSLGDYIVTRNR
jgi:octaprenyl-diphosphate synthase